MTRSESCARRPLEQVGDPLAGPDVELAEHAVIERSDHSALEHPEVARDAGRREKSRTRRSA